MGRLLFLSREEEKLDLKLEMIKMDQFFFLKKRQGGGAKDKFGNKISQ